MPFGLRDFLNQFIFVYLDDILIFPNLRRRLLQHQLFTKAEKFEFHQSTVSILVFIITPGQIQMDPEKVNAILNWPIVFDWKQFQHFPYLFFP